MKQRTWHSGPPPSVGWWPASGRQDPTAIRWWDGGVWSLEARPSYCAEDAAFFATKKAGITFQDHIKWTERWWE